MLKNAFAKLFGRGDGSSDAAPTSSDRATASQKRDHSTPEQSPHAHRHCSSRRPMSSPDTVAGLKSRNQLRRGKFRTDGQSREAEVISDSDENEQRQAKKPRLDGPPRNQGLNPISDRKSRQPTEDDQIEARLLGGASYATPKPTTRFIPDSAYSQREPEETTISDPASREDRMRKKPTISRGFVPSNTLDSVKRPLSKTRGEYMHDQLGQRDRVSQASTAQTSAEQGHFPNKKRKVAASPTGSLTRTPLNPARQIRKPSVAVPSQAAGRTRSDAISLEDSPDGAVLTPIQSPEAIRQSATDKGGQLPTDTDPMTGAIAQDRKPERIAAIPKSASHHRSSSTQRPVPPSSRKQNGAYSPPDAPSSDGVQFMRDAKRQRKESNATDDDNDDEVQEIYAKSVKHGTRRRDPTRRLGNSTPKKSAQRVLLPPESPDELQADPNTHNVHTASQLGGLDQLTPNIIAQRYIKGDTNRGKLSRPRGAAKALQYKLKDIATPMLPGNKEDYYQIDIYPDGALCIVPQESQLMTDPIISKNLAHIYLIHHGGDSCLAYLKFRGITDEQCLLRFGSTKNLVDFVKRIQDSDSSIKVYHKEDDHLWKVFHRLRQMEYRTPAEEADILHNPDALKREVAGISEPPADPPRQVRTVDKLDAPSKDSRRSIPSVITGRDRRGGESLSPEEQLADAEQPEASDGTRATKKTKDFSEYFDIRHTRSQPHRNSRVTGKARESTPPREKIHRLEGVEPWRKPLVYPFTTKKQETVDFESLKRLEDDEFLNDTLISFFQRLVEHKVLRTQPEQLKRVHLFNSYFFDSLTRNIKTKKDVNYEGVKKWTKNINLFARDYVVVPVNLSYHWFLIIICNLTALDPTKQEDDGADANNYAMDRVEAEGTGPASDGAERDTRHSFQELSIQDSPLKPGKKAGKKKRQSLQKYDPKAPVIISLDSLNQSRSVSCGYLKQYIVQAAAEKFPDHPIDEKDIKAMTAKDIPIQSNYSDCGLYLCLYLEHFLRDPDQFVRAMLQREPFPWPEVVESERLRGRYRDLLLQLHKNQESKTEETIPDLGSILAEPGSLDSRQQSGTPPVQERPAPLEGTRRTRHKNGAHHATSPRDKERSATPDDIRRSREYLESRVRPKKDTPTKITSDLQISSAVENLDSTRRRRATPARTPSHEAIVIEDDPESPPASRQPELTREKGPEPAPGDGPLGLAEKMRKRREGDSPRESPEKRNSRSASVSTEYLHGAMMYGKDSRTDAAESVEGRTSKGPVKYPVLEHIDRQMGSQVSAEVPETPEDVGEDDPRNSSLPQWSASEDGLDEELVVGDSLQHDGKAQENRAGTNEMIMY